MSTPSRTSSSIQSGDVLTRQAGVVSFFTTLSRITGLIRDTVFTHLFGANHVTDAFLMAFTIPNTFRMLVAEGALTVAFLPVFNEASRQKGEHEAQRVLSNALAVFPVLSAALTGLCMIFAEPLVGLFAHGYNVVDGKFELTVLLTRWMFPFLVMISVVALVMGALNARRHFGTSAASPLAFNLVHVVCMIFLAPHIEPTMVGVAVGVLIAGMTQVALQFWGLQRAGMWVQPKWALSPDVLRILGLMAPATVALAIYQINLIVLRQFASFLGEGAVSFLFTADRFFQLPLGIFSIAIATASLPSLADAHTDGDKNRVVQMFGDAVCLTNFISIPATVGMAVLAHPIIATVFQHGRFDATMASATAKALLASSVGLVAVSGIRVAGQVFFAIRDTRTPVACSSVGLAANVALSPWFALKWDFVGLAFAVSLSAWLQYAVQLFFLRRRMGRLGLRRLMGAGLRDGVAGLVMGFAVYGVASYGRWREGSTWLNMAILGASIAVGFLVYVGVETLFKSPEWSSVRRMFLGRVKRRRSA